MIEEVIIAHLADCLAVPVSGEVPADPPASFVTVEKTGVGQRNFIYTSTLSVRSWAPSQVAAAALNEAVKVAMADAVQLDEVSRCHLNSDFNDTDTTRNQNRYQAIFSVVHY